MVYGIYGDQINSHLEKNKIFEHGYHSGNLKVVYFDVIVVKHPDNKIIMMSTYYGIMVHDDQKEEC